MDIFEEIKEAVMQATPGENTRNYYRNQGMATERQRILELLEADLCTNSEWGWTECYGLNKEHCEHLNGYIKLIKGEANA